LTFHWHMWSFSSKIRMHPVRTLEIRRYVMAGKKEHGIYLFETLKNRWSVEVDETRGRRTRVTRLMGNYLIFMCYFMFTHAKRQDLFKDLWQRTDIHLDKHRAMIVHPIFHLVLKKTRSSVKNRSIFQLGFLFSCPRVLSCTQFSIAP
jgi:hypothetical protein